ncbi:hypothetical protein Tco_1501318 [Tanacetum coccineum]
MFSTLCGILLAKLKSNIYALFFCIPEISLDMDYYFKNLEIDGSDKEVTSERKVHEKQKKDANTMSVEELIDWAEEEAKSPYLRSPPLNHRPLRKDLKGKVMRAADIGETMDNEDVVKKGIDEEAIAKQKTLDKGNGVMNSDQGKCVRKKRMARPRGNGISIRENDDTLCGSDSNRESEVIELRKRMTCFKRGGDEAPKEFEGYEND